jgi:hypothetical protein
MEAAAGEGSVRRDRESVVSSITIRGREFSAEDLRAIKAIVDTSPDAHRFALSKMVCEALGWYQPNGRLKDRACRAVLARLHEVGFLRLPVHRRPPVTRRPIPPTESTAPRPAMAIHPCHVDRSCFSIVTGSGYRQERLWNEYVERYHALGYGVPVGPHIKYLVSLEGTPIACLSFASASWRLEARDRWVGWSDPQRRRNLRFVVNNTRFLILPWIHARNLASRLLALAARRLRDDWLDRYGLRPLLIETFVDTTRYAGTCYRAANWVLVGHTKGRGRMDRHFKAAKSRKAVLVYPLVAHAATWLRNR